MSAARGAGAPGAAGPRAARRARLARGSWLLALGAPSVAFAHPGRLEPHDLWTWGAWTWEPGVVLGLVASAALYAAGTRALRRRAGRGRGVHRGEAAAFAAGWVVLVLALCSPVHAMGGALFSAHMAQHELLVVAAAPLLVVGRPLVPALWGVPRRWRGAAGRVGRYPAVRRSWRWLTRPGVATAVHAVALWGWHLPALYTMSLRSELAHTAQHASFFGTGLLFWWAILNHRARRTHGGAGVLYLFLTALHTGALGALIAVASTVWYPAYTRTTAAWGLTPLEDQQLAGIVMWVPAGIAYVVAALWLFASWLGESGRRAEAREALDRRLLGSAG